VAGPYYYSHHQCINAPSDTAKTGGKKLRCHLFIYFWQLKEEDSSTQVREAETRQNIVGTCDDMPASWVSKLHIARDKLDMRCPKVAE
jgi:hypothetical protein